MGRHRLVEGGREGAGLEDRVAFEGGAGEQRGGEPGGEALEVARRHEAEDPVARLDPHRRQAAGGGGGQRLGLAAHRHGGARGLGRRAGGPGRGSAGQREGHEAGGRRGAEGGGVAPVVEDDLVEAQDAVRDVRAEGGDEAQREIAHRDPAHRLGGPLGPEHALGQDGEDLGRLDGLEQAVLVPGDRQQAGDVAGLLDRQEGEMRLGHAGHAQADGAPRRQPELLQALGQARDDLAGGREGPGDGGTAAPIRLARLVDEGDAGGVPVGDGGKERAQPHRGGGGHGHRGGHLGLRGAEERRVVSSHHRQSRHRRHPARPLSPPGILPRHG